MQNEKLQHKNQDSSNRIDNIFFKRLIYVYYRFYTIPNSSIIVEKPLQIGSFLCKTKPICFSIKIIQPFFPQRIMKMKAFAGQLKNKANLSTQLKTRQSQSDEIKYGTFYIA